MKPTVSKVYNLIILDESGSMEEIKHATIGGFNELIQSIKHSMQENPGIEQYVNFYSFNGSGITEHLPLVHVSHLKYLSAESYIPNNSTPLYDAIGLGVNKLRKALEIEKEYSVLVTILTDGEENSSKEYTYKAVSGLIETMKTQGWVFTYIGANHDVEKVARSLNINNHLSFNFNNASVDMMYDKTVKSRNQFIDKIKKGRKDLQDNFFKDEEK